MQTSLDAVATEHRPWNKGKLIGQKPPLQPKHVWAIRTRLQLAKPSTTISGPKPRNLATICSRGVVVMISA